MGAGIDWGRGMANIDTETGIRYGVISVRSLDYWYNEAEPDYGPAHCPGCGEEAPDSLIGDECPDCGEEIDPDHCYTDEPTHHLGTSDKPRDGYFAVECSLGVFVEKSPYYTLARFCSPCAPGAGDLDNPDEDGVKTYCFGHDWFEGGKAPYPVYDVKTGALVEAKP